MKELANEFSRILTKQLGTEIIGDINWLNETSPPHICASHNFCDANEIMAEAFEKIVGVELNIQLEEHKTLWNQAWTLAKNNKFQQV